MNEGAPFQSFDIPVSAVSIPHLQKLSPGVDGASVWCTATQTFWVWLSVLPAGLVTSADGSSGAITSTTPNGATGAGFWVDENALNIGGFLSFASVVQGAVGSGRMADLTAAQILALRQGQWTWVQTVRDYWVWDATSTATSDPNAFGIFNPPNNPNAAGRFVRQNIPSPTWMVTNRNWVIRPTTGNFENPGTDDTPTLALDSSLEFQRRTGFANGSKPAWGPGDYHIFYPEGVGVVVGNNAQSVITGRRSQTPVGSAFAINTQLYVHGNTPSTVGQGVAFAGPFTISAVTALNHATNQALQVASAGIAGSWTAAALISTPGSNVAKRCRMTTGANTGGTFWAKEDLGNLLGGNPTAMCDEPAVANVYSGNFLQLTATFTPAVGDQFVVETLATWGGVVLDTDPGLIVIAESVSTSLTETHLSRVFLDKCQYASVSAATYQGGLSRLQANGCRFSSGTSTTDESLPCVNMDITNCNFDGAWDLRVSGQGNFTRAFIHGLSGSVRLSSSLHSNASTSASRTSGWLVNSVGIFNVPNTLAFVVGDQVALSATAEIWGSGNAFAPLSLKAGAKLYWPAADIFGGVMPASYFFINVGAGAWIFNDMAGGNGANAPAWDPVASVFTAPRLLSPANLQATVAAGGFNGHFFDPLTHCGIIAAQQG